MKKSLLHWIKAGYEIAAYEGLNNIKIESLALKTGISKSSFYHHFAEMEIFIDHLLQYHLQQADAIAKKERAALCIDPDLLNILVEHKTDILFNRQLRIHQEDQAVKKALIKSNEIVGDAFVVLWLKNQTVHLTYQQTASIFTLALDNFYLQIHPDNFTIEWLQAYFTKLQDTLSSFS